jgi:Na+/phosphate symporter
MEVDIFQAADKKFRLGREITDKELRMLLKVYKSLSTNLRLLGEHHRLSYNEIERQRIRMEDMKKFRGLR